jgi:hypothetical protein
MAKLFIPFGSLNLDGPIHTHPSKLSDLTLIEAMDDVIPGPQNSTLPRRSLSVVTTPALGAKALGCISIQSIAGEDLVFAGSAAALYKATSTITATFTFSDVSAAGGYTTATGEVWEFAEWQHTVQNATSRRIIATNFTDAVQEYRFRSTSSTTVTFISLISTPAVAPRARHVGIIGQFVVLGNTQTISTSTFYTPSRVWWSAFGVPSDFSPSATTQSDYEDLPTGGAVQKVIGGNEYGYIFQQKQVQVMRYVGGTTVFDFAPVNFAEGTPVPNSVIAYDGAVYYISAQGFHSISGIETKNIGNNLVDGYFWRTVEQTRLYEVTTTFDPLNKLIIWAFPTDTAGYCKKALAFHIPTGRWARWTENIELLATIRRGESSVKVIAFNTDHKLCTFTSDAAVAATISTKAIQPVPGRRWQCNGARILMDMGYTGATATGSMTVKWSDNPLPASSPSASTSVSLNPDNYINLRTAGRFQQFTLSLTAPNAGADGTMKYTGMELDYEVLGER